LSCKLGRIIIIRICQWLLCIKLRRWRYSRCFWSWRQWQQQQLPLTLYRQFQGRCHLAVTPPWLGHWQQKIEKDDFLPVWHPPSLDSSHEEVEDFDSKHILVISPNSKEVAARSWCSCSFVTETTGRSAFLRSDLLTHLISAAALAQQIHLYKSIFHGWRGRHLIILASPFPRDPLSQNVQDTSTPKSTDEWLPPTEWPFQVWRFPLLIFQLKWQLPQEQYLGHWRSQLPPILPLCARMGVRCYMSLPMEAVEFLWGVWII